MPNLTNDIMSTPTPIKDLIRLATPGPWKRDGLCVQAPDGNIALMNLARAEAVSHANAELFARLSPETVLLVVVALEGNSYWWPVHRTVGGGQASCMLPCGHIGPVGAPCCQACAKKRTRRALAALNGEELP